MTATRQMLQSHPDPSAIDVGVLAACIDACVACAQSCTTCADACLGERDPALADCIGQNLQCADICRATAAVLSRPGALDPQIARDLVAVCAAMCERCGTTCAHHGEQGMSHCEECARACSSCADACRALLAQLNA